MKARPYRLLGLFDAYGGCRYKTIFKEADGSLSQMFPGHFDQFATLAHKRWSWNFETRKLERGNMDWEPDAEEMDKIERLVATELQSVQAYDRPRYSMDGAYPNYRQVARPA